MHIHGTAVTVDRKKYTILFTPLSYRDWVYYLDASVLYTPAAIRYLFATYVTDVYEEDLAADGTAEPGKRYLTVDVILAALKPAYLQKILDLFITKSGFNTQEEFDAQLNTATTSFRTHIGIYDMFLFLNLPTSDYLTLLREPAEVRALIIAGLQLKTGVDVKERVADVERNKEHNIALDLIHSNADYEAILQSQGYQRTGQTAPTRTIPPDAAAVMAQANPDMFMEATRHLQERLNRDKHAPKKTFDWRMDETDFIRDDADSDTTAMNRPNTMR